MYARVTPFQGDASKVEDGIRLFNETVLPVLKGVDGYKGAFLFVDRSSGKAIGASLWESEDARERANDAVAEARERTIQAMGGSVPPVDHYEVAVSDLP